MLERYSRDDLEMAREIVGLVLTDMKDATIHQMCMLDAPPDFIIRKNIEYNKICEIEEVIANAIEWGK